MLLANAPLVPAGGGDHWPKMRARGVMPDADFPHAVQSGSRRGVFDGPVEMGVRRGERASIDVTLVGQLSRDGWHVKSRHISESTLQKSAPIHHKQF